jgi:hypothetical protein
MLTYRCIALVTTCPAGALAVGMSAAALGLCSPLRTGAALEAVRVNRCVISTAETIYVAGALAAPIIAAVLWFAAEKKTIKICSEGADARDGRGLFVWRCRRVADTLVPDLKQAGSEDVPLVASIDVAAAYEGQVNAEGGASVYG